MNIGKIVSVEYDKFQVKLFHTTKTSTISLNGQIYYFGNIGSFLKVQNSTGDFIICEVIAILDHSTESKLFSNYNLDSARETHWNARQDSHIPHGCWNFPIYLFRCKYCNN